MPGKEELAQGTIDALTSHIAILYRDEVIIRVNRAWSEYAELNAFGSRLSQNVGANYLDYCSPSGQSPADFNEYGNKAAGIREIIEGKKKIFELEYPNHNLMPPRWFLMRVTCFESGNNIYPVVAHEDITTRKQTEEILRESEERMRLAMRAAGMYSWEIDLQTQAAIVSDNFAEVVGFAPGMFPTSFDNAITELIYPEDAPRAFAAISEAIESGGNLNVEYRFCVPGNGEIQWLEAHATVITDNAGTPLRLVGIAQNITGRKRAEDSLRHQKTLLESLTESVLDGILIVSPDGQMIQSNQRFRDIWNFPPKIIESQSDEAALRWAAQQTTNPAAFLARVASVYEQPDMEVREELTMNDGRVYERYGAPIPGDDDRRLGWVWTFRDITKRKQAEEDLRESRARLRFTLESASIGDWDVNLETGKARRSFLHDKCFGATEPFSDWSFEKFLTFAHPDDRAEIELKFGRAIADVETAAETVRPLANAKNIVFDFQSDVDAQKILGDTIRLQQIVINLANNAVKFTSEGGAVILHLHKKDEMLQLEIIDTGIGIKRGFLPLIFDRFQQADSSTRRVFSGLGLGLTIVRHLTELHDGTISVESMGENFGSVFTLRLPFIKNNEQTPPSKTEIVENFPADFSLRNVKILLVDNDCEGLQPLQIMLEQHRATVECANSAAEAIEKLNGAEYDLLISDIGMPETDGYDLITEVRASGRQIPAIALTAYASMQDRDRTLEAGFQHHLSKPVDFEQLLQTVRDLLNSSDDGKN